MKIGSFCRHFFAIFTLGFLTITHGAETRIWTSSKGSTIKAKLQRILPQTQEVALLSPEAKVVKVKIKDLSLADRHHLVEFADADKKILTEVPLVVPENVIRFNKKTFKKHDEKMGFGDSTTLKFNVLESEHFLIASSGKFRAHALAETAERLWFGMAFQHQNFRKDWGDKKQLVIISDDEEVHQELGNWYFQWLEENIPEGDQQDEERKRQQIDGVKKTWNQATGLGMTVPEDQQKKYSTFGSADVFRVTKNNARLFKKVFGPFPTHSMASSLITHHMGGVSEISPKGYFAITRGHAFFKEIQLAKKSETQLIDPGEYKEDDIASTSGFTDGRSWAKTLRKLVRKGKITPSLEKLLEIEGRSLTPEGIVLMYSFAYYMQSDSARLTSYANMVRRIESNDQVPEPIEIARLFGFESVESFETDWIEFVKSTKFK